MARRVRTIVDYFDDLNGEQVPQDKVQTIPFAWSGVEYEIDLGPENAEYLSEFMERITSKAQRIGGRKIAPKKQQPNKAVEGDSPKAIEGPSTYQAEMARRELLREVRNWANTRGMEQSMVGRIKPDVRAAWNEAFPDRRIPDEGVKNFQNAVQ